MTFIELRAAREFKIALENASSESSHELYDPSAFEYIANDGSYWKLNRKFPTITEEPHKLPTEEDLLNAQLAISSKRTAIPEDLYYSPHSRAIQFFLQNWWRIRDIFKSAPEAKPTTPRCYAEIDFGELGRPDFVGMLSDGSLAVIEFGLSSKAPQVALHAHALSQVVNPDTMPIYPFTARYGSYGRNGVNVDLSQVNAINIVPGRDSRINLIPKPFMYGGTDAAK